MGQDSNGSRIGRLGLCVALFATPVVLLPCSTIAGITDVSAPQQKLDPVVQTLISHEAQNPASAEMYLPDPAQPGAAAAADSAIPEITIPQLPSEVSITSASSKDGANAIPLPPAVQSGLTGLAALGLAGGLRRLRRVLR